MDPGTTGGRDDVVPDGGGDDPRQRWRTVASVTATSLGLYTANVLAWVVLDGPASIGTPDAYLGFVLHGIVLAAILGGVWYLRRRVLEATRYPRIRRWYAGGLVAFLALNLALIVAFGTETPAENASWAVFAANIGAAGGLIVGIVEARAIDRAVRAEREAVRAASLERQRDWFEYINRLLRHEILNNVQVVQGQVTLLDANPDGDDASDRVATIQRRLEDMTGVVEDVREVIRATGGQTELQPVSLPDVLRDRLSAVVESHDAVDADLTLLDEPTVRGDVLLPRIFDNLLENAVKHSPDPNVHVNVTVERAGDVARVTVADDGPGIDAETVDTLFEPSGGTHGMGLHLVEVLAVRYGGSVELSETGPEGTTFVVELPLVADDSADAIVPVETEPAGGPFMATSDTSG